MGLGRHVTARLLYTPFLIMLIMMLTFLIVQSAPGDPVMYLVSGLEHAPPGFIEAKRAELGLDKPIYERMIIYIRDIFTGNFGYSFIYGSAVSEVILAKLKNTLILTVTALLIEVLAGTVLGIIAARRRYSVVDAAISVSALAFWSMPFFWMAILAILMFAFYIPIFPIGGMITPGTTGMNAYPDIAWHLFLPATVLGLGRLGLYTRMTRASILEVMHQDYILTAWSKGCDERTVLFKHALRNALLPLVTLLGLRMGNLFMGAVLVEIVFGWPGMGTLIYDAIFTRDYAIVQLSFLMISIVTVLANLGADIVYAIVDPRIRYK